VYLDPYLVGIIRGDGSANKRKDGAFAVWVDQAEKNRKIAEEVKLRFERLGLNTFFYKYYAKQDKAWKYRALVYSKELFMRLKSVFRNIRAYINKLSDGEAKQFIAGVLDAEGTITDRIVIYNKNMVLLRAVQNKLNELGIFHSHIYKFGVVHGLQIYRRESLKSIVGEIPAVKLRSGMIALSG
jgi:LAGLIDADG DNA endonuclease family protein